MQHSTGAPTKTQEQRFILIKEIGCVCCHLRGFPGVEPDIHHLKSGNLRISHDATIGLCKWHHEAWPFGNWGRKKTERVLGPSLKEGARPFHDEFGSDEQLLEIQNQFLAAATGGTYAADAA
jgi:hypothetical protein